MGKTFWKKDGGPEYSWNLNCPFGRSEEESKETIEHNLPFYKFNQSLCPKEEQKTDMVKIFIGLVSSTQCNTCLTGEVLLRNSPLSNLLFSPCQPRSYGTKPAKHFKTQQKKNQLTNSVDRKRKTDIPNSIRLVLKHQSFLFCTSNRSIPQI